MALKTDYKDAAWSGNRLYQIADAADGKKTITDATQYTVAGDPFGAKDINATNAAVNRAEHVTIITLRASGWTGAAAPYSQTVAVSGVTANDNPLLVSNLSETASAETQAAYAKAFGRVASGAAVTVNGSVTFKVYKKPAVDISVGLKGV